MKLFTMFGKQNAEFFEKVPPQYETVSHADMRNRRFTKVEENVYRAHTRENVATITCVGDMLCEEKMYHAHRENGNFFFHNVFQYVRPFFCRSDLVIGNLETCLCEDAPYTGEQYKVEGRYHNNAPIEFLDAIQQAGFDFLVMANNHNLDCGFNGILETLERVDNAGLMHTGLFRPEEEKRYTIAEVNGIRIAVLAYSTWYNRLADRLTKKGRQQLLNEYSKRRTEADIAAARKDGAEFVLVYMHWGVDAEYKSVPSSSMEKMAQEVADSGADYIIGSHTHSLQPYTLLTAASGKKVPCIYSVGNFVTSELSKISRETGILQFTLEKRNGAVRIVDENFVPCYVPDSLGEVGYPVVPVGYADVDAGTRELIQRAHAHAKEVVGECSGAEKSTTTVTTWEICSILGLQPHLEDESYTMVNFARDARDGGVAIISEITSDPTYRTPESRYAELADIAVKKGAKLLISAKQIKDYPCLVTEDVFDAYCKIIKTIRSRFVPRTVAITGSIGKTTATEMTYTVLSSKFNTHRNTGSANSVRYAGTVIQQLKPEHQVYVQENMEGPPYGAASTIAKMVQPQAAIVTVVGSSHLEMFGSQERILESCLGVQDGMPEDGLLILNGDDPFQWNATCSRRVVYYGIQNGEADYRATNIRGEGDCLCFDLRYGKTVVPIRLHCFGQHNVLDALAAFAAGKWAGMTDREIANGLEKYRTSGIRQNLVRYGGYRLFLDCYNAAPESVQSALDAMSMIALPKNGHYVGVLADIKEVGKQAEEFHRKVGKMAANSCLDMLICYGNDAVLIAEEARKNPELPVYYTSDFNQLVELLKEHVTRNDVVLFKGSHSMELELVADTVWGTWFHEEFERYDFKTHMAADQDLRYRVYTDHATVVNKISRTEDVVIPDFVDGVPVTGIERSTFSKSVFTKSVRFPAHLVNVRYCAFYQANSITEVELPGSVKVIDNSAFSTCEKLARVVIGNGCTHIGYRAFGNCKNLQSVTIPATVKQIGEEAFLNCRKLTIYGETSSYAEQYAKSHKIPFESVEIRSGECRPNVNKDVYCTLMDGETGECLFEQNGEESALIASVSKIMLAYRQIKLLGTNSSAWQSLQKVGDEVTLASLGGTGVESNSTVIGRIDGVTRYLQPGDELTEEGLLYGALVVSGNDAAAAIASAIDGNEMTYLARIDETMHRAPFNMSDKSRFGRVYGRDCYSTARDISKAMYTILHDDAVAPVFWRAAGAPSTAGKVEIIKGDGTAVPVERSNTHPFIGGRYKKYLTREIGSVDRICGKTGTWIKDFVLTTAVEHNGKVLIATVLHADNEKKRDDTTLALLSWGFKQFD